MPSGPPGDFVAELGPEPTPIGFLPPSLLPSLLSSPTLPPSPTSIPLSFLSYFVCLPSDIY